MKPEYEIVCTNPKDYGIGIASVGYKSLILGNIQIISVQEAIKMIRNGECSFYVNDGVHRVSVVIGSNQSIEYLTTEADGRPQNNLNHLPSCPTQYGILPTK
ncbi:TPA: DUF3892 domain-containing protein [Legionella bozemanae]